MMSFFNTLTTQTIVIDIVFPLNMISKEKKKDGYCILKYLSLSDLYPGGR